MTNAHFRVLVVFASLMVSNVSAEVVECHGVWQNAPCGAKVVEPRVDTPSNNQDNASTAQLSETRQREDSQRRSALHDLEMKKIKAQKLHGIELSTREATLVCNEPAHTLHECIKVVSEREDVLEGLILQAQQKRAEPQQEQGSTIAQQVTVIQNIVPQNTPYRLPRQVDEFGVHLEVEGGSRERGNRFEMRGDVRERSVR
jgi:hypothetical protein